MNRLIKVILIVTVLACLSTGKVYAENVSGESASLKLGSETSDYDFRVQNLKKFFEKYNSPLAAYSEEFVVYADANNLDYRLIPAITGVESTFGKHIPVGSYNAYGWANGEYEFTSWEDSIEHVSFVLKKSYIDRGIYSIRQIAKVYAPPSSSTWGNGVTFFVKRIDTLPLDFDII